MDILFSLTEIEDGAIFFGGNIILRNPGSPAFGIGPEFASAHNFTGGFIIGGSLKAYIRI